MPTISLYCFRYRDQLTGKWVRARYKAEVPVIQRRYPDWELIGSPEIRHVTARGVEPYSPFRRPAPAGPQ